MRSRLRIRSDLGSRHGVCADQPAAPVHAVPQRMHHRRRRVDACTLLVLLYLAVMLVMAVKSGALLSPASRRAVKRWLLAGCW